MTATVIPFREPKCDADGAWHVPPQIAERAVYVVFGRPDRPRARKRWLVITQFGDGNCDTRELHIKNSHIHAMFDARALARRYGFKIVDLSDQEDRR